MMRNMEILQKQPILTDDVKEEVKDLDHVENATFIITVPAHLFIITITVWRVEVFTGLM